MTTMIKTYSEAVLHRQFIERFRYLKLSGSVGFETFGINRLVNQRFYKSKAWLKIRDVVIIRDEGCDLGVPGYEIAGKIMIHHIVPITLDDIINMSPMVLDPENLICCSHTTHNAIHYGDEQSLAFMFNERKPNDTKLW